METGKTESGKMETGNYSMKLLLEVTPEKLTAVITLFIISVQSLKQSRKRG